MEDHRWLALVFEQELGEDIGDDGNEDERHGTDDYERGGAEL